MEKVVEEQEYGIKKALILPFNSKRELLIQDRRGHRKPDWGLFGGSIEEGETPIEAIIRETKEELSIDLQESDMVYIGTSVTDWDGIRIIRYLYLYHTDQEKFDVKEGQGGYWFSFDEARKKLEIPDRFDQIISMIEPPMSNIIKTKTFQLAAYTKGDKNSSRVAIVLPGRLDTKDYASNKSLVDFLATKGFLALSFDPPGTWESPGDIELYTTTNCIKAVNELIEYFGSKPTLLVGFSRGGAVAILVGSDNPAVMGVVTIMASYGMPTPPTPEDIVKGFKVSLRTLPPGTKEIEKQIEFCLPISYFEDGSKYDVVDALKKVSKPKLIIYGDNDEFTDPEEAKEIYKTISEPRMVYALHSDHDYRYHVALIEEVNRIIRQFVDKYFPNRL